MKQIIQQIAPQIVNVYGNYFDIHGCNVTFVTSAGNECHSDTSSSPAADNGPKIKLFCRITQAAYDKGIAKQVDDDLRSASVSAPKLVKTLKLHEALGNLDTMYLPSTELYILLDEHYHLPFKSHAFSVARSK